MIKYTVIIFSVFVFITALLSGVLAQTTTPTQAPTGAPSTGMGGL